MKMLPGQYPLQRGQVRYIIIGLVILAAVLLFVYPLRLAHQETGDMQGMAVTDILGSNDTTGYSRAYEPRIFSFPLDNGPHPDYRHEWWYYTGNLKTATGRRFGYQLTFFRFSLSPHTMQRDSQWAASQMMMAHFALSDIDDHKFYQHEKTSRLALGLAGSEAQPFTVWVDNWNATGTADSAWPMTLHAVHDDNTIDLTLVPTKPLVLQGDKGLSRKSSDAGNATYYYSYSNLQTYGVIRTGGDHYDVSGHSWLDREWGTSSLAANQSGWDWFALQLSDDSELMAYRLRRKDGSEDPFSSGMLIGQDGDTQPLQAPDFNIQNLSKWRSPHTHILYPSRWRLSVPSAALELEIEPLLHDQELHTSINYWEGAVWVHGKRNNRNITGYGYVELTGYDRSGIQITIN
jgi:predicted secreted hydrolase